jgi:DNA-binding CsgD family transcriptional regulator
MMMLEETPHFELQVDSDRLKIKHDVENMFRQLIYVAGYSGRLQSEAQLTFEVCLDGRTYAVLIVECVLDDVRHALSPRELEIAQLIAKGLPTKAIAARLGLRPCTVSTYTKRIYLKLNVNSRSEMVAKVLREPSRRFYDLPLLERPI